MRNTKNLVFSTLLLVSSVMIGRSAFYNILDYRTEQKVRIMSDLQLHNEVERLSSRICPPKGTSLQQIEQVYGKSSACGSGKGTSKLDLNCHSILLLSYFATNARGTALTVSTRKGRETLSSIFHGGSTSGMKQTGLGLRNLIISPNGKLALKSIYAGERHDNELALKNLRIISRIYSRSLARAPWLQQS